MAMDFRHVRIATFAGDTETIEVATVDVDFDEPVTVTGSVAVTLFVGGHSPVVLTDEGEPARLATTEQPRGQIGRTGAITGVANPINGRFFVSPLPVYSTQFGASGTVLIPGTADRPIEVPGDTDMFKLDIKRVVVEVNGQRRNATPTRGYLGTTTIAMSGVLSIRYELSAVSCLVGAEGLLQVWTPAEVDLGPPDTSIWILG